jgi:hypothetical protein
MRTNSEGLSDSPGKPRIVGVSRFQKAKRQRKSAVPFVFFTKAFCRITPFAGAKWRSGADCHYNRGGLAKLRIF